MAHRPCRKLPSAKSRVLFTLDLDSGLTRWDVVTRLRVGYGVRVWRVPIGEVGIWEILSWGAAHEQKNRADKDAGEL